MPDEPRDNWSKLDILGKSIGALLLQIILLILGNAYTSQQEEDNEAKRNQERVADEQQNKADRVAAFLNHLASSIKTI